VAAGTPEENGARGDLASADQVCKTPCLKASRLRRQPLRRNRRAPEQASGIDRYPPVAVVRCYAAFDALQERSMI
jgi:hypothetical protein